MDETPIFRAVKRRKQLNKPEEPRSDSENDNENENISQLVKSRTQQRARLKGVQFSNQRPPIVENANANETGLTLPDPAPSTSHRINDRFIGSTTGQVVNVDKHMTAYIDSELARKRQTTSTSTITPSHLTPTHHEDEDNSIASSSSSDEDQKPPNPKNPPHNSASLLQSHHHLTEVNLPPTTQSTDPTTTNTPKPRRRKPRLGRDGKPLRPRPRKRRPSNDITRDTYVDQVLHEHGLLLPTNSPSATTQPAKNNGTNVAADERMAAEFQQAFLDAAIEKQQAAKQKSTTQNKTSASGSGTVVGQAVGGPRLGGGRSARARMAAMQAATGTAGGAAGTGAGLEGKEGRK